MTGGVMKKTILFVLICFAISGMVPLAAQENASSSGGDSRKSDYYFVTVHIEKVYPYRKGYAVSYRQGINKLATVYLPIEWFHDAASKGELIYLHSGNDWPHLTVYYKEGEFSHVRLYLRKERGHPTWGNVPLDVNLDDRFEDTGDFKLVF
jgi:hypothetical protein